MTRQQQKEQRRLDILYKGLELFVEKGYKETKITDIAEELNISVGLLFHYFESKEDLYYELVRLGIDGTNKDFNYENIDSLKFIKNYVQNIFNAIKNDKNVLRMFLLMPEAQRRGTPERIRELALKVNIIDSFIPIIIKGQNEGTIKNIDPKILSNTFFRSLYGICEGFAIDSSNTLPPVDLLIDILRR